MLNRIAASAALAVLLLLAPLVQSAQADRAKKTKCANNLRQLGLASVMYSDDKRFFPHVGKLTELDGRVNTNHVPRYMLTLLTFGYLDNPEVFVCPESYDAPNETPFPEDARTWNWGGKRGDPAVRDRSPIGDESAPTLDETTELSYGWTRKGMNRNVRSTALLGADRAVNQKGAENTALAGNHADGWNVLMADCAVQWLSVEADPFPGLYLPLTEQLKGVEASPGYLAIKPQVDKGLFEPPYSKPRTRPGKLEPPKRPKQSAEKE